MKTEIYVALAVAGLCVAGAAVFCCLRRREKGNKGETVEKPIPDPWVAVLTRDARVFNGLFSGLQRVVNGVAKKPEKILREWCQRTHYKWENAPVDILCQGQIMPLVEAADRDGLTQWAKLLLAAAAAAGITKETAKTLVLTEQTVADYVDWEEDDLYPEDAVEIIAPAWYQDGKLLEQGQCKKQDLA